MEDYGWKSWIELGVGKPLTLKQKQFGNFEYVKYDPERKPDPDAIILTSCGTFNYMPVIQSDIGMEDYI